SLFQLRIHIVQSGESLFDIANSYHVNVEELIKKNPQIAKPAIIMPGMKINLPYNEELVKEEKMNKDESKKQLQHDKKTKETQKSKVNHEHQNEESMQYVPHDTNFKHHASQ